MKKTIILSVVALASISMSAQEAVVKEAEKAMKNGKSFIEVVEMIKPATLDASTSNQAFTYFIPGKAAFKEYDNMLGKRQLNLYKADATEVFHTMALDLVGGYDYMMKALSLDTIVDAKGKVKTKYSKEIVNTVKGHHSDYNTAALDFWNVKDFKNAYRAWDIYLTMKDVNVAFNDIKMPADTLVGEIMYNQALAAWQCNNFADAVKSFRNAIDKGYTKSAVFEYGAAVADAAKDFDAFRYFATKGSEYYPEIDNFINLLINAYLKSENYDEALEFIDKAISNNPQNAQYYALKGIIYDNKKIPEEAMKCYSKALSINDNNPLANFYYGIGKGAEADKLSDAFNGQNFDNYKEQTLNPLRREAVKYLEKAYDLDKNLRGEILKILEILYYNLDDEAGQEGVKQRKLDD